VTVQAAVSGTGALVLSEFTGAATELTEALPSNPFDVTGLAGAIVLALELDEDDRGARIERMGARVARHDVFEWLRREIETVTEAAGSAGRLRAGSRRVARAAAPAGR
jgi:trehalose 6-phosphate synthase